jgi:nitroreductase
MMNVTEAIRQRRSTRAFLPAEVPAQTVRDILEVAGRAPSSSNLQPWQAYAIAGQPLADFKQRVRQSVAANPKGEAPEYAIYAPNLKDPYNARRIACAEELYRQIGIERENKFGRMMHFARNFDFYGAPIGIFLAIDRTMERGQWADLGIYLAHILLLAEERGLATCAQAAWAAMHRTVRAIVGMPEDYILYCGISLGFADPDAAINDLVMPREPASSTATFIGFDTATA